MTNEPVKLNNKNGTEVMKIAEPAENDPCIRNDEMGQRRFWENTELKLIEKTGLTRKWLYIVGSLLLVHLVFLITIIILAALWPRIPHYNQFPICSNPACLRFAAKAQESLNASVSPCDDVWSWACGGWLSKNPLPPDRSVWNPREQLSLEDAIRIRNMVTTLPLPLHTGTVEWKMKHLYEACLEVDNVNADQERPLTTLISELGGWYILRDWSLHEFNTKEILRNLHEKYGTTPYFKISVKSDPRMPGANAITITPSGLGLPDRSYYYLEPDHPVVTAYKELIRDVVMYLSATRSEADKFGNDIFHYEKRIAEITPDSFNMTNPVNTYNPIKLSELKLTAASLPLQDILMSMFPESGITEETEVIVTSHDYLMKVSQIVASTDQTILNGYVMWTLVKNYLPYLSSKFTAALDSFHFQLEGMHRPVERWEKCVNLLRRFMGFAVEAKLDTQHHLTGTTKLVLDKMFKRIINIIKQKLNRYKDWPILQKHLQKKIYSLKLQIGLPENVTMDSYLKWYYSKLIVIKANLFESYKFGLNFLKKNQEQRLITPHIHDEIVELLVGNPEKISYSPSSNTIIVPLRTVINQNETPTSVIYAQLGIDLAEAIISSILPFDSAWTSDMKLLSPFHSTVNDSFKSIEATRNCLSHFIEKRFDKRYVRELSLNTLKHLSAIIIAHEAMQQTVASVPHIHQPSLETYEDSGVFFLAYAQTKCEVITNEQIILDSILKYKLRHSILLRMAWEQIPTFSTSLDCSFKTKNHCSDIF